MIARLYLWITFTLIANLIGGLALGQDNFRVEYENPASSPDFINVCGVPDEVRVSIQLNGSSTETRQQITAKLYLFTGVEMVSYNALASSAGVILLDDSDPGNPVFGLPTMSPDGVSEVIIQMTIAANCELVDTIRANDNLSVFDTWTFEYLLGGQNLMESDENSEYRDALAVTVLNIDIAEDIEKRRVGDCFEREVIISNGAISGFTDSVHYENIQGRDISVRNLRINGFSVPFDKETDINGDTIISADIIGALLEANTIGNGPGNGDQFLDPDESITIIEEICIQSCDDARGSTHLASWGCFGTSCNEVLISDFIVLGEGAPNALILESGSIPDQFTGYCQTGVESITIINDGTEIDPGFGAMTDIEAGIGLTLDFLLSTPPFSINSATLAGVDVSGQTLVTLDQNPLFTSDPDGPGGLTDIDNDGYYDDLAIGESFEIQVTYEFDCSLAQGEDMNCRNDFSFNAGAIVQYVDACQELEIRNLFNPPIFGAQNTLGEVESTNRIRGKEYATDAIATQDTFFINHFLKREIRNFQKNCNDQEEIQIKMVPPSGVIPFLDSTYIAPDELTLIDTTHIGDTVLYRIDATQLPFTSDLDIEFQMAFITDCNVQNGISEFPYIFSFVCPPCDCEHTWLCDTLQGPYLHNLSPPCPQGLVCDQGLQTIDFEALRTTFGYTDGSYSTKVDPNDVFRLAGIPCDSVTMTLTNLVGNTPVTDSIGVVIHYDNVDMLPGTEEIFLFDEGELIVKKNGNDFTCPISSDQLTVTTPGITKILRFDLDECLDDLGITLQSGDTIIFKGSFAINGEGQMLKEFELIPDLRGYAFATIDGVDYACDNFGAPFLAAKKATTFATPPNFSFIRGCTPQSVNYAIQCFTIGAIDEFFPNEFRPSAKVDSIVFEYDPLILESFSTFELFVKIPDHPIHGDNFYSIPGFSIPDNGRFVAYFDTLDHVPSLNSGIKPWNLRIDAIPNCKASFGSSNNDNFYQLDPTIYFTDKYYALEIGDGSCSEYSEISKTSKIRYEDQPELTLSVLSEKNVALTNDTAEWVFRHCNLSDTDIGWTWFALEDGAGEIEVISVELIDDPNNPITLPIVNYGINGQNAYTLTGDLQGVQLSSGTDDICNTFRVTAIVSTCEPVDLLARAGWNCEDDLPPDWTPEIYPPCDDEQETVSVFTPNPFLDAEIIAQPTMLSPCDTNTITVLIKNTTGGTAFDLRSRFIFPDSSVILVPGGVEVAYPATADFVPALGDPVFTGTTSQGDVFEYVDFSEVSGFLDANGLPGFDPGNTIDSLNSIKIRFKVVADCPFNNGSLAFYNFQAMNRCGELSNQEAGSTLPLMIEAIDPISFNAGLSQSGSLFPNGSGTLAVDIINMSGFTSGVNDLVEITLPAGVLYQQNSSIAITPGSWTISDPVIDLAGGSQILTWNIPAGIGPGETANFTFDVDVDDIDCDLLLDAFIEMYNREVINCTSLGSVCEIVTETAGRTRTPLLIECGEIMGMLTPVDTAVCPGETVPLLASGGDTYEWIASPSNPGGGTLNAFNIPDPIFTGGVSNESYTFTVIISESGSGFIPDTLVAAIQILSAPDLTVSASPSDMICSGQEVELTVSGATNYEWYVLPDNIFLSNATSILVMPDETTTYKVIGTNDFGCVDSTNITIEVSDDVLDIKVKKNEASCGLENGAIKLEVFGGSGNYAYEWDPDVSDMNDAFNLAAGFYSVTVTDLETGCTGTETIEITEKPGPQIILSTTKATCDASNGSINVEIIGGTPTYSVEWDGPVSGSVVDILGPDYTITDLPSGTYTVTVIDMAGCSVSELAFVGQIDGDLDIKVKKNEASCGQENGVIKVEVLSGSGDYSYEWDPPVSNGPEAYNLAAGIYVVTVTDNETGCVDIETIEILDKPGPDIEISTTKANCDAADGGILIDILGGTPPYKVIWDGPVNGEEINVSGPQYMIDGIPGGNYTVTIMDLAGCTVSENVFVDRIDGDLDIKVKKNEASCGMSNGVIETEVLLGSGDYTYTWDPPVSTGPTASLLPGGIYTVTVVDNETGCSAEETVEIQNKPGPEVDLGTSKTTCGEDNGMIQVFIQGGNPNYSVAWNGPESGQVDNVSGPEFNITDLPAGDYTVLVIDQNGCEVESNTNVGDSENNLDLVDILTQHPACNAENGEIELNVTGAQGALSYSWMPNVSSSNIAEGLAPGLYFITVTDGDTECSLESEIPLGDSSNLQVDINVSHPTCSEDNGEIDLTINGGSPDFLIEWIGPQSGQEILSGNSYTLNELTEGIYELSVSDEDGCTYQMTVVLMASNNPIDSVLVNVKNDVCGQSEGRIDLEVISSATNLTYQWSPAVSDSATAINLSAGIYSITVGEAGNPCDYVLEVEVQNENSLSVLVETADASCGMSNGELSISIEEGNGPFDIHIDGPVTTSLENVTDSSIEVDGLATGDYILVVQAEDGCEFEVSFSINTHYVGFDYQESYTSCEGELVTLIASGNYQFFWFEDGVWLGSGNELIVQPSESAIYELLVSDGVCSDTFDITVDVLASPNVVSITDQLFTCDGDTLLAQIELDQAISDYQITGDAWFGDELIDDHILEFYVVYEDEDETYVIDLSGPDSICHIQLAIELLECSDYDPCDYFGGDEELTLDAGFCDEEALLCLDLPLDTFNQLTLTVDGQIIDNLEICNADSAGSYALNKLFNLGSFGPFFIESWQVNGNEFNGFVNDVDDLLDSLNSWDPTGNWDLAFNNTVLAGGAPGSQYDTLIVASPGFGTAYLLYNESLIGGDGAILLAPGSHQVVITDNMDCTDTLTVNVECDSIYRREVIDTILVYVDTVQFCLNIDALAGDDLSIVDMCADKNGDHVIFDPDDQSICVTYHGIDIGTDTACYRVMDQFGNMVEVSFMVHVRPPMPAFIHDEIYVGESDSYCLDLSELAADIVSVENICPAESGVSVDFDPQFSTLCVAYSGLAVGTEEACIVYCDENDICDTAYLQVQVLEEDAIIATANDDCDLTATQNQTSNFDLLENDSLPGPVTSVEIIGESLYGTYSLNGEHQLVYTADDLCEDTEYLAYQVCTAGGCDTAEICIYIECEDIIIYNGFSPNNDGVNDHFHVAGIQMFPDNVLFIYNRWGNLVYQTESYNNDWEGEWFDRGPLPNGTYYYVLKLNDSDNRTFTGYVQLMR